MKKVEVSFNYKSQSIYVFANYYSGCDATTEEPAEEPTFEIIELNIGKTEFDSVEDLAEHLDVNETELDKIILKQIQNNLEYGKYF